MTSCKNLKLYLAVSFVEVAVLLGLLWVLCPVSFETNDDMTIMNMVSGFYTGVPTSGTIFSYYLWGKFLSTLYGITGSVSWYALSYMLLIFVSLTDICFHLTVIMGKFKKTILLSVLSFAVMFFSVFCYYSTVFQFTAVSALCGTAAIVNICTVNCLEDKSWRAVNYVLTFILYLSAYNIRPDVGYLALAGYLMTIFIKRFIVQTMGNKIAVVYLFLIITVVISSYGINKLYEYKNDWLEFRAYSNERVTYMDYSYVAYNENPELYAQIGWSEELAALARAWFFLDESVTTDTLRTLNNEREHKRFEPGDAVQQIINWAVNLIDERQEGHFTDEVYLQVMLWFWGLVFCSIGLLKKKRWRNILEVWGYFCAFAVIEIYFLYQGRLPLRVIESIIYIFMIPGVYSIIINYDFTKNDKEKYIAVIMGVLIAAVILMPTGMWNKVYSHTNSESGKSLVQTRTMMEDYAISHKDNIYIYSQSLDMPGSPLGIHPDEKPLNLFSWGGCETYSPPFYEKLSNNGLTELYTDNFFKDNVFLIMKEEISGTAFYRYMQELYPDCYYDIVEETAYFNVYKLIR